MGAPSNRAAPSHLRSIDRLFTGALWDSGVMARGTRSESSFFVRLGDCNDGLDSEKYFAKECKSSL